MFSNDQNEKDVMSKITLPKYKTVPFSIKNFHAWEKALVEASRQLKWSDNVFGSTCLTSEEAQTKEAEAAIASGLITADEVKEQIRISPEEATAISAEPDEGKRKELTKKILGVGAEKATPAAIRKAKDAQQKISTPNKVAIAHAGIEDRFKEVMRRHKTNYVFLMRMDIGKQPMSNLRKEFIFGTGSLNA